MKVKAINITSNDIEFWIYPPYKILNCNELPTQPENLIFTHIFYCGVIFMCSVFLNFVCLLPILLSVLWFMTFDYPCGIFKLELGYLENLLF